MDFAAGQTLWDRERDAVVGRMMAGGGGSGVADPGLVIRKNSITRRRPPMNSHDVAHRGSISRAP